MKTNVLIVDDHPENIEILEETLADEFEVRSAGSGEEALEILQDYRPDIVFLDIMMPGMDGYDVCRRIRENGDLKFTKVVFVSAREQLQDRLVGYEAGGDDYLTKPFNDQELLSKARVYRRLKVVEEVDSLKDTILALLASESRTPVHSLTAPAESLLMRKRVAGDVRQRVGTLICRNAEKLGDFFNKVLAMTALPAGSLKLRREELNLSEIVRTAVETCRRKSIREDVAIEYKCPRLVRVSGDKDLLERVFKELADNASRFSPRGDKVAVEIVEEELEVCVRVTDHGKGIAANRLPRVFKALAEIDENWEAESCGSGLSLAMAHAVVTSHGGSITVESRPGELTVFTVRLPLIADAIAHDPERPLSSASQEA